MLKHPFKRHDSVQVPHCVPDWEDSCMGWGRGLGLLGMGPEKAVEIWGLTDEQASPRS